MPKNINKSNFIIQGSILAFASLIVRIIGVIYRIPLTNILGQQGIAIYSVAFDVYSILLLISSYSLPLAVSKLVSYRVAVGQMKNSYRIFIGALIFSSVVGLTVGTLAFTFADAIMDMWMSPESAVALKVLAPTLVIMSVVGVFRGYFQGLGTMIPTAISNILEQIANAIVSVVAAKYLYDLGKTVTSVSKNFNYPGSYGAAGGTLGTAIGAFIALLFLIFVFNLYKKNINRQNIKDRTKRLESYSYITKILVVTIVPVILSTTIYNISGFIDSGIFHNIMDAKGMDKGLRLTLLGAYTGEYRLLMNVPIALAASLAQSIIPSISASISQGNRGQVLNKVNSAIRFSMVITIPCAVGLAVLATPIITLLFPTDQIISTTTIMLRMGSVSVILYVLSTLSNSVLQGINKMRLPVRHAFISLIIHVILLTLLLYTTNLNVYALVITDVLFALVITVLNAISLSKHLEYRQEVFKTFILPLICAVIMGIFTYFSYKLIYLALSGLIKGHLLNNAISCVFSIIISVAAYGVSLLLFKVVDEGELYSLPKGRTIVKLLKKLHLL